MPPLPKERPAAALHKYSYMIFTLNALAIQQRHSLNQLAIKRRQLMACLLPFISSMSTIINVLLLLLGICNDKANYRIIMISVRNI